MAVQIGMFSGGVLPKDFAQSYLLEMLKAKARISIGGFIPSNGQLVNFINGTKISLDHQTCSANPVLAKSFKLEIRPWINRGKPCSTGDRIKSG